MTVNELKKELEKFSGDSIIMIPSHDTFGSVEANHLAQGINEADGCLFIENSYEHESDTSVVEIVKCKNCKHRETKKCLLCVEEFVYYEDEDGYATDYHVIINDYTTDEGFCHIGEL